MLDVLKFLAMFAGIVIGIFALIFVVGAVWVGSFGQDVSDEEFNGEWKE